jgi:hypothetical protein
MPKRKRKRTRIKPGPFLVVAVLVVFISGIFYSPLTSLSKVAVTGAKTMDQAAIQQTLSTLNKIPWIMVNPRWVETRIQRIQSVDHAAYSQNIFGRGHLEVTYRIPVAKVRGATEIGLDAKGVMFETDKVPEDLPSVFRPESAHDLPVAMAAGFPSGSVADLAIKARQLFPKEKLIIWFNKPGFLCLNVDTGLVILGSCDDLDSKLSALKDILDQQPGLLAKLESLNLTEPTHPAKTYKRQRE